MDRKPGSDPRIFLRLSEQFLRRRHFDDCRKYALQAHHLNPKFPGVNEMLAVADVLLAAKHQSSADWYEVMQVNRYSQDSDLIKRNYDRLHGLLNPSVNKFPFADEAFEIVGNAWRVLSDPLKKAELDEVLKKVVGDGDGDGVFWTVCPYCYYVYEFPRVYVEVCLRCPNDECGKAFTCVEIDRPPVEVLAAGEYVCCGFVMLGFRNGCWNPFEPLNKAKPKPTDDGIGGQKAVGGRKKSFANTTKKVTGVGNRVKKVDDCVFF